VKAKTEARKQAARADFGKWLAAVKADEIAKMVPTNGLVLHAPLTKGEGKAIDLTVAGKPRSVTLESGFAWEPGHTAAKAFSLKEGKTIELPEVGDFDAKQGFSFGAWVKFPARGQTGSVFARMDNTNNYRGWDLWYENGKLASHIIHKWPDDALKVVTKNPVNPANDWHHVFVT
jgi:hypothetical protein